MCRSSMRLLIAQAGGSACGTGKRHTRTHAVQRPITNKNINKRLSQRIAGVVAYASRRFIRIVERCVVSILLLYMLVVCPLMGSRQRRTAAGVNDLWRTISEICEHVCVVYVRTVLHMTCTMYCCVYATRACSVVGVAAVVVESSKYAHIVQYIERLLRDGVSSRRVCVVVFFRPRLYRLVYVQALCSCVYIRTRACTRGRRDCCLAISLVARARLPPPPPPPLSTVYHRRMPQSDSAWLD